MNPLEAFKNTERLAVPAQTKLTASEHAMLRKFVDYCHQQGLEQVTISSAVRTFVVTQLEALDEELGLTH